MSGVYRQFVVISGAEALPPPPRPAPPSCLQSCLQSVKYALNTVFNVVDFGTDILSARALAHSHLPALKPIGLTAAGLLSLTVPINVALHSQHRHRFPEVYKTIKQSGGLRGFDLLNRMVSATNVENGILVLDVLQKVQGSTLSASLVSSISIAKRDLSATSIYSQISENVPQFALQMVGAAIMLGHDEELEVVLKVSLATSLFGVIYKLIEKLIVRAVPVQASEEVMEKFAKENDLKLTMLSVYATLQTSMQLAIVVFDGYFVWVLGDVDGPYQTIALVCLVISYLLGAISVIRFLQHQADRIWHAILEPTMFTVVTILATAHPLALTAISPDLESFIMSTRMLLVGPILRGVSLAALSGWAAWKSEFGVDEIVCIATGVVNGMSLLCLLFALDDTSEDTMYEAIDHKFTIAQLESEEQKWIQETSQDVACDQDVVLSMKSVPAYPRAHSVRLVDEDDLLCIPSAPSPAYPRA